MSLLCAPPHERAGMTAVRLSRDPSLSELSERPLNFDDPVRNIPLGYAHAAGHLVRAMQELAPNDTAGAVALLPPYLFLWRHHIELQLKGWLATIQDFEDFGGLRPNHPDRCWGALIGKHNYALYDAANRLPASHSLLRLWNALQPYRDFVNAKYSQGTPFPRFEYEPAVVEGFIRQLHDIDPKGDGARYRNDREGNVTLMNVHLVHIEWAQDNLQRLAGYIRWGLYATKFAQGEPLPVLRWRMEEQDRRYSAEIRPDGDHVQ